MNSVQYRTSHANEQEVHVIHTTVGHGNVVKVGRIFEKDCHLTAERSSLLHCSALTLLAACFFTGRTKKQDFKSAPPHSMCTWSHLGVCLSPPKGQQNILQSEPLPHIDLLRCIGCRVRLPRDHAAVTRGNVHSTQ